jgi:hypothetical protein
MDNIAYNLRFHFIKKKLIFMKNCKSYQVLCVYYPISAERYTILLRAAIAVFTVYDISFSIFC